MKLGIYSIRDDKAEAFMTPHYFQARGQALREFGDAVNDPKAFMSKHPGDYSFHYLGEFDDRTGEIIVNKKPELVARGSDYITGKES